MVHQARDHEYLAGQDTAPAAIRGTTTRPSVGRNTAVDQAFRLIGALQSSKGPLRLSDLVKRTGMPKTSAHRILWTLIDLGIVGRNDSKRTFHVTGTFPITGTVQSARTAAPPPMPPAPKPTVRSQQGGQRNFSAPVRDRTGLPVAQLTMSVRAYTLPEQAEQRFNSLVRDSADQMAELLSRGPRGLSR